ncbi:MAG: twin-arginine translocation signal domain-containing protein, partial [Blastocatellia bacterium]
MKKQDIVSRRTVLKGAAAATAASTFTIINA